MLVSIYISGVFLSCDVGKNWKICGVFECELE